MTDAFDAKPARFLWLVVAALIIVAVVASFKEGQRIGTVYASWPDRACQHVRPEFFDCDNLPDRFEVVWVSPEWRP